MTFSARGFQVGAVVEHQAIGITDFRERAALAEKLGARSLWLVQMPNQRDILTLATALTACTESAELATGIVPLYSRPPVVMAHQAIAIDELSGGRFALGLGLGHRGVGEWMVGAGAAPPPVASMREYFGIVATLVRDGEVGADGAWFSGHSSYAAPRRPDIPVFIGAYGTRMLELAGEVADGAILWMCSPDYIRDHAIPAIRRGQARRSVAGNFRIAAMLNADVTSDVTGGVEGFRQYLSAYLRVPTYRRLFEVCGYGDAVRARQPSDRMIADLAAIGPASLIRDRVLEYAEAGVTDVILSPTVTAFWPRRRFLDTLEGGLG